MNEKTWTVDSCMCFKLETGGLIIGWYTYVSSILGSILCAVLLILLFIYDCTDLANYVNNLTDQELELCGILRGVVIGVSAFLIVLSIGFAYLGWKCIQGTKARDHVAIKPLLILFGVTAVLSLLQILTFTTQGVVNGMINGAINGYCFIVLNSLYNMFRREYENSSNNKDQFLPAGKV